MAVAARGNLVGHLTTLGDPVRLRMLHVLDREELSVGELCAVLHIPQSTASRHLKALVDGDWATKRTAGPAAYVRMAESLEADQASLWEAVRGRLDEPVYAEDLQRLDGVLASRRADSTSFFGRVAGRWDDLRRELFGDGFTAAAAVGLLPRSWRVADLGCGTGNVSEVLAPWVAEVVAVDSSRAMLEAAGRRLGSRPNVRFVHADLGDLPLEDGSVDAAVCFLVLHHADECRAILDEAARVLRTVRGGGTLMVVDMVRHEQRELAREMGHKRLGFAEDEITDLYVGSGFAPPTVRRLASDPAGSGPGLFAAVGVLATGVDDDSRN